MKGKIYAMYKGDNLLGIGTTEELAELRGVKEDTIIYYHSPSKRKRTGDKGIFVIDIEEEYYE